MNRAIPKWEKSRRGVIKLTITPTRYVVKINGTDLRDAVIELTAKIVEEYDKQGFTRSLRSHVHVTPDGLITSPRTDGANRVMPFGEVNSKDPVVTLLSLSDLPAGGDTRLLPKKKSSHYRLAEKLGMKCEHTEKDIILIGGLTWMRIIYGTPIPPDTPVPRWHTVTTSGHRLQAMSLIDAVKETQKEEMSCQTCSNTTT